MFKTRPANIKINSMLLVECQITSSFDFGVCEAAEKGKQIFWTVSISQ